MTFRITSSSMMKTVDADPSPGSAGAASSAASACDIPFRIAS